MPPSLQTLDVADTGCDDAGMTALAAALPRTALRSLGCAFSPAVTARGWAALAAALPQLPALRTLVARGSPGMGDEGARAFADSLPQCRALRTLDVGGCGITRGGGRAAFDRWPSARSAVARSESTVRRLVRARAEGKFAAANAEPKVQTRVFVLFTTQC